VRARLQLTYNKFEALYHARKQGHKILFTTGWIGFGVLLFQPLASSLFELNVVTWTSTVQGGIPSKQTLGLSPDTNQLNGFVAAAGVRLSSGQVPRGRRLTVGPPSTRRRARYTI
jgi:hypothetical protein